MRASRTAIKKSDHSVKLENMKHAAPFMQLIGAVHGAHYFLVWDNAAFFAANALVEDVFVLMISFTTGLTRPVSGMS